MDRLPGQSLLMALCLLTSPSLSAASIDSTLETSGSLSAELRGILESPETTETTGTTEGDGMTGSQDPSLDFYYSRLGTYGSVDALGDLHGVTARPRGDQDSTTTKKKDPKPGVIAEPHAAWLLVAGALGLIAFRRRRAR